MLVACARIALAIISCGVIGVLIMAGRAMAAPVSGVNGTYDDRGFMALNPLIRPTLQQRRDTPRNWGPDLDYSTAPLLVPVRNMFSLNGTGCADSGMPQWPEFPDRHRYRRSTLVAYYMIDDWDRDLQWGELVYINTSEWQARPSLFYNCSGSRRAAVVGANPGARETLREMAVGWIAGVAADMRS